MNVWFHVALTAIILFVVTNVWLMYRVLRPLRRLAAQATDVANGNLSAFQQPCEGIQEIGMLHHAMASMAGHVRRSQEENAIHHSALSNGEEAERARIAHELHDDTVQALIGIAQSIELASNWMASDAQRAAQMMKLARGHAVESVDNLRRLIANLRPPELEELGLVPALQMLGESTLGSSIIITSTGPIRRLPEAQELALFRSAQEAIRNAERHGYASQIDVEVAYQPDGVKLTVEDNGTGFQQTDPLDCLAKKGHYGLLGIQERVQHLRGILRIATQPGQEARVEIVVPSQTSDQPVEAVRDPVCGAMIQPQQAYGSVSYEGTHYYFCCPVCQGTFQHSPQTYLIAGASHNAV